MAISKKRAPVSDDKNITKILQQVYKDINEVINSVNSSSVNLEKLDTDGKAGDIRVVKNSNGIYAIEAKTEEGWITTNTSTITIPDAGGTIPPTMAIKGKE